MGISENNQNQDDSCEKEKVSSDKYTEDYDSAQEYLHFEESSDSDDPHPEANVPASRQSQRIPKLRHKDFVYLAKLNDLETLDDPETVEEAFSRTDVKFWKEAT